MVFLVLGELLLAPLGVAVYFFESRGVDIGQFVGCCPHNRPVPVVEIEKLAGGSPLEVGDGEPPGNCSFDPGAGVFSEGVKRNVVRQ